MESRFEEYRYWNNIVWLSNSICNEYQEGFDSLKEMVTFFKQKQLLDKQQLEQFEYDILCVQNNLAQLDAYDKNIDSMNTKFVFQTNDQSNQCANVDQSVTCLNAQLDHEQCYQEKSIMDNSFYQPLMADSNDMLCSPTKLTSSIDDLLSLNDSGKFVNFQFKFDSCDSHCQAYPVPQHAAEYDQENQNCLLTSMVNPIMDSDPKAKKSNCRSTKLSRQVVNKSTTKGVSSTLLKKAKSDETRIWYKCAWEGCSFGSFYNGVVKRHSYKRHSGKIKIDKSSNSTMHRFKCDWPGCEVSLVAYHKLVEHKRKHTGEKPFRCKWKSCNYATARLYSMIIHERTHKLDSFID